ncbi:MAG: acylphosphatase [Nitrospirota bacterium]
MPGAVLALRVVFDQWEGCAAMTDTGESVRARILVSGHVQGVGYRAFTCRMAASRGLTGHVENLDSGQVAVDAEGNRGTVEEFISDLKRGPVGSARDTGAGGVESRHGSLSGLYD